MPIRLVLLWLLCTLPLIAWAELFPQQVRITADRLNVRDDVWGNKIGQVVEGQQFLIRDQREGWGRIEFELGKLGWVSLDYTKSLAYLPATPKVGDFCDQLNSTFQTLAWEEVACQSEEWRSGWDSERGRPLLYQVLGDQESPRTTLLVCAVHGDEGTAYHCFRFRELLDQNPGLLQQRLVIVPMLNPDGFFEKPRQRTNANGVDLNRNLPTKDWPTLAQRQWQWSYGKNPRYNPGQSACSEKENQFLVSLILEFSPDKIVSLHSPLDFLDLDYMDQREGNAEQLAVRQRAWFQAKSFAEQSGIRFRDYQTFPGSLGRFGNEWKIPVYTLEFPSHSSREAPKEFDRFRAAMLELFNVNLSTQPTALRDEEEEDQLL